MAEGGGDKERLYSRWPLLLAAFILVTSGLALDLSRQETVPFAIACLVLGATAFGAFVYAEGARHREWWAHKNKEEPDE